MSLLTSSLLPIGDRVADTPSSMSSELSREPSLLPLFFEKDPPHHAYLTVQPRAGAWLVEVLWGSGSLVGVSESMAMHGFGSIRVLPPALRLPGIGTMEEKGKRSIAPC
jgi:hypothetical protein